MLAVGSYYRQNGGALFLEARGKAQCYPGEEGLFAKMRWCRFLNKDGTWTKFRRAGNWYFPSSKWDNKDMNTKRKMAMGLSTKKKPANLKVRYVPKQ